MGNDDNEYNISDLLCFTETEAETFTPNNKKTMNLFEQRKFDKFADSGRVDTIEANIEKAELAQAIMDEVSAKLDGMVHLIEGDKAMLNNAVENADINGIEAYAAELEAKLEIVEDKDLSKAIASLSEMFGIEVKGKGKANLAETRKAMGLVAKKTAKTKAEK